MVSVTSAWPSRSSAFPVSCQHGRLTRQTSRQSGTPQRETGVFKSVLSFVSGWILLPRGILELPFALYSSPPSPLPPLHTTTLTFYDGI